MLAERLREIEHERIQSEIKKNNAEAERMEAEAKYFKESWRRIVIKYSIIGVISVFIIWGFALDMFKNFYDLTYYENKSLKAQKDIFYEDRDKFNKELLDSLSSLSQQYAINIELLELFEMEMDAYSTLFFIQNSSSKELIESRDSYNKVKDNFKEQIQRIKKLENDILKNIQTESKKIRGVHR